jgi:predicted nucleic acid-binding protein
VILLAADMLSALRRPERHPRVAASLMAQDEGALSVSTATIGEIARGVALEAQRNQGLGAVLGDWLDGTCLQFVLEPSDL